MLDGIRQWLGARRDRRVAYKRHVAKHLGRSRYFVERPEHGCQWCEEAADRERVFEQRRVKERLRENEQYRQREEAAERHSARYRSRRKQGD